MAEQLLDRLINPVDNLREETRRQNANASGSQVSRANRQSSQSTESEMRRLYPSINSNVRTNVNVAPVVGSSVSAPDRNYVPNIRNFQLSTSSSSLTSSLVPANRFLFPPTFLFPFLGLYLVESWKFLIFGT